MSKIGRGGGQITPDEARRALWMWLRAAPSSNVKHAADAALRAFVDQYAPEDHTRVVEWLGDVLLELCEGE